MVLRKIVINYVTQPRHPVHDNTTQHNTMPYIEETLGIISNQSVTLSRKFFPT